MDISEKLKQMKVRAEEYAQKGTRIANLELRHISRKLPKEGGQQWYEVSVTLDGPRHILQEVEHVEYQLHPSFDPDRVRRDNPPNFELRLKIWGMFTIRARVQFRDGQTVKLARYLRLPS